MHYRKKLKAIGKVPQAHKNKRKRPPNATYSNLAKVVYGGGGGIRTHVGR